MARTVQTAAIRIAEAVKQCDVDELDVWVRECSLRGYSRAELESCLAEIGYRREDEIALRIADNAFGRVKHSNYLYGTLVIQLGREKANWAVCKAFRRYARQLGAGHRNHPDPQQKLFKLLCRYVPAPMAVAAFAHLPVMLPYKIRLAVRPKAERANERGRRAVTAYSG